MSNRLLSVSLKILKLLYAKKLWVNNIIEQTSRDRTYVIRVLESMEKAKLLTQGPRSIGRKRPIELTSLGIELTSFYYDLDNFKKSYLQIRKFRRDIYVEYDHVDILRKILRSRKWDEWDIEHETYDDLQRLFGEYMGSFFDKMLAIVHHRSLKILHRYKIDPQSKKNEIIMILFERLIHEAIDFVYGDVLGSSGSKRIRQGDRETDIEDWIHSREGWLIQSLRLHSEAYRIPFFAMDELSKASTIFIKLIDPDKSTLTEEVQELKNIMDNKSKSKYYSAEGLKHASAKTVLETFSECLKNKS
jgi:hypothetical protein